MTKEDKELLLKDLCARLPYGVKVYAGEDLAMTLKQIDYECFCEAWENEDFKCHSRWMLPYIRPMSSMTEEEKKVVNNLIYNKEGIWSSPVPIWVINESDIEEYIDFCNLHHLDWRGLIIKGLALEAPEEMYKKEE